MNAIDTGLSETYISYGEHTLDTRYLLEKYTDETCLPVLKILQQDAQEMENLPNVVFISRRVHFISQLLRRGIDTTDLEKALKTKFMDRLSNDGLFELIFGAPAFEKTEQ